jgi:Flp pilus assembly pilin Flp
MSRIQRDKRRLSARLKSESGQVLLEYALVLGLIAIVSIAVMKALGVDIRVVLNHSSSQMASVSNP